MKPEHAEMSADRLTRVRSAVERHVGEDRLAGSVTLIARRGEIVQFESCGLMDRERQRPMGKDAIFRIFSMTKPITCTAFMILFERGLLRLSQPVAEFIPAFADARVWNGRQEPDVGFVKLAHPLTLWHLLTHTSGMTYHFNEYGPVEEIYREAAVVSDKPLAGFVEDLAGMPLSFQPGAAWRYGFSHDVVARVVEIASGKPFGEFLSENIFEPLGMRDTAFRVPPEKLDRLVAMYGTESILKPDYTTSAQQGNVASSATHLIADPYDCAESRADEVHRGGHGLVSTAEDYYRFCRMLLKGGRCGSGDNRSDRILGRKSVELMTVNHLPPQLLPYENGGVPAPGYGYGLGVRVLMDVGQCRTLGSPGEFGWGGAATTYFWVDPAEEMIGIQMSQHIPGSFRLISQDVRVAAYQAIDD